MTETGSNSVTYYQMESVVPSWLASDAGYLAGLRQALSNRMALQGWDVTDGPRVEDTTSGSRATVPVGMTLLNVWCGVTEFDFEVPDTEPVSDRADSLASQFTREAQAAVVQYRNTKPRHATSSVEPYEAVI
jgi:hypothetical protein